MCMDVLLVCARRRQIFQKLWLQMVESNHVCCKEVLVSQPPGSSDPK